jgi:hypothetical protein
MKALSLPSISTVFTALLASASAQISMTISTTASYRQNSSKVLFNGAAFNINLRDGSATFDGCSAPFFFPPSIACPIGSTGFVIFGLPEVQSNSPGPYYSITSITPAILIEPREPKYCMLTAAPASTLPRPLGGFQDNGYGLYYNLLTTSIRQYSITDYSSVRRYTKDQRSKFVSDIVPGSYYYSFPRLGRPELGVAIPAQVYPMPEGLAKINNQDQGFRFGKFGKWNSQGFLELSYLIPNIITWEGLTTSGVIGTDTLYLSIRVMSDQKNPTSPTDLVDNLTGDPQSVFPGLQNGGDPRVLLSSPFVTSFTAPPILDGGTRGILEIQLERSLQTSAVTYDRSKRTYQVPVAVVNSYTDYRSVIFGPGSNAPLLIDSDGDGFNNLNEWILDSDASQKAIIPIAPTPNIVVPTNFFDLPYFGFTVNQKLGTDPAVAYTLQRSKNGGRTWTEFTTDADWIVTKNRLASGEFPNREMDAPKAFIQVTGRNGINPPVGTLGHIYRVKITLR